MQLGLGRLNAVLRPTWMPWCIAEKTNTDLGPVSFLKDVVPSKDAKDAG